MSGIADLIAQQQRGAAGGGGILAARAPGLPSMGGLRPSAAGGSGIPSAAEMKQNYEAGRNARRKVDEWINGKDGGAKAAAPAASPIPAAPAPTPPPPGITQAPALQPVRGPMPDPEAANVGGAAIKGPTPMQTPQAPPPTPDMVPAPAAAAPASSTPLAPESQGIAAGVEPADPAAAAAAVPEIPGAAPAEGLGGGIAAGSGGPEIPGQPSGGGLMDAAPWLGPLMGLAMGGLAGGPSMRDHGQGSRGGRSHLSRPGGGLFKGAVKGSTPGRADSRRLDVARGSYVVPADVVSSLGQGNTEAGHGVLQGALRGRPLTQGLASGGIAGGAEPVPVLLSDGEHVFSPDEVSAIGGVEKLDAMVHAVRGSSIEALKRMPPPK